MNTLLYANLTIEFDYNLIFQWLILRLRFNDCAFEHFITERLVWPFSEVTTAILRNLPACTLVSGVFEVKQVLRLSTMLAGIALILAGTSAAQAFDGNMYITLKGAKAFSLRSTFDPIGGTPTDSYNFDYEGEWAASTSLGYRLNEYLRLEGELGYLSNAVEDMSSSTISIDYSSRVRNFTSYTMANILADLPLTDQLTAFAGGGIGIAKPSMDKTYLTRLGEIRELKIEDQYVFAWKLTGGLAYEIYENTRLFADYTYFQTADFDVRQKTTLNGIQTENTLETNLRSHMIGLGLRYDF